jgi:hypothetical protein
LVFSAIYLLLGEGDTFTFLNLIDNGLLAYQEGMSGGWAGYGAQSRGLTTRSSPPDPNFTPAVQNAFAARMKWSVTPKYSDANHEPSVMIRGSSRISARPGEMIRLRGVASDSDGNAVTVKWWQWKAVDTCAGQVTLSNPTSLATSMEIPADATAGQMIHLILEATDNGTPALTRYQRIIISVTP